MLGAALALAAVAALAALGGCAAAVGPSDGGDVAPADPPLEVTLEQEGGYAGIHTVQRLSPDGSVVVTDVLGHTPMHTLHAPGGAADAATLAQALQATGVFAVAAQDYRPMNRCCDRIEDTLTLTRGDAVRVYSAMSDGAGAPAALLAALRQVNDYIRAAR